MNAKLLFKTTFLLALLGLLVLIGKHNTGKVSLALPPVLPKTIKQPAAMMYYGFFAAGVLAGTIMTAGGGGKKSAGSSGGSAKPAKKEK